MEGLLRSSILAASRSERVEKLVTNAPVSRDVVRRFVGGADDRRGRRRDPRAASRTA